jgi:hypothetical protein
LINLLNKRKEKGKKKMKYKALLLDFLLLLPMGLIAGIRPTNASHGIPGLYVNPPDTKFNGPCIQSTTFEIDVYLWNSLATDYDIYAFDFNLTWTGLPIALVNATYHAPWANFFEIVNETFDANYHLALMATPPSTGLYDVNVAVLRLWFHVEKDLCWPAQSTGTFHLISNGMSADGTAPVQVLPELDDGTYEQFSVQPNIDLSSTDPAYNVTSNTITEKCVSHTFDIEVDLTNVTDVYGFFFTLRWDPTHLETDAQKVTFKAAFPPPYEYVEIYVWSGSMYVNLVRPSEKPAVCGAKVPAVDIVFHTIDTADRPGIIPTTSITKIRFSSADIYAKCPQDREYEYGFGNGLLLYGGDLTYNFKPSRYDLNLDCVVDVQDLKTLLPYYGTTTGAGGYGDIFNDGAHVVDVFDFVAISKNFGPVDP